MTCPLASTIENSYQSMQGKLCIEQGSALLSEATQFYANDAIPVHRWFHFKEGFAADLLDAVQVDCTGLDYEDGVFLDPFCGSGTTILAGDLQKNWRATRIGFEINPFLCFVARTKANWRQYDAARLSRLASDILGRPLREDLDSSEWPSLSTLHNPSIFAPSKVSQLLDAIRRIGKIPEPERDLLLLGAAATAEKLGYYRKDGRALRILRSPDEVSRRTMLEVKKTLEIAWAAYAGDLRDLEAQRTRSGGKFSIFCSDGRRLEMPSNSAVGSREVNLMFYSPPYFNHIDYTEVYKVELWLLGFITGSLEMRELRKKTLRSHASIVLKAEPGNLPSDIELLINFVASEVERTGKDWHKHFRNVALGYFEDLQNSLRRQFELLRPGRQAVCVVANSAHGSGTHRIVVAVDLIISALAANVGFEVQKLIVARQLRRRDSLNRYLRETVIVMRRPAIV